MESLCIEGGIPLKGRLPISGSKNALLPLMVASLLTEDVVELCGIPHLADGFTLGKLLQKLGADVKFTQGEVRISSKNLESYVAPYNLVSKMRASFWVIGPLLTRFGRAQVSLPGGCAIGTRPVDFYLESLIKMGATIKMIGGNVHAVALSGLSGAIIDLPFPSVGVTHVMLMVACLAKGETVINNAACEPEVIDLGRCLQEMGARIDGLGTSKITIEGVDRLSGVRYHIIRDRIEAGAYACAVLATHGDVVLENVFEEELGSLAPILQKVGANLTKDQGGLRVQYTGNIIPQDVITAPYPGFSTDLQAPFMALMCVANGVCHIQEKVFENRFMHVQELVRLGAEITLQGDLAVITGPKKLIGAPVMATDLRASMSLVIAALVAEGETNISRVYHLDRGYEKLESKLSACGARVYRKKEA